jgi:hypothetical protein
VQTYTYDIKPIKDNSRTEHKLVMLGSTASSDAPGITMSTATTDSSDNIHSYEVGACAHMLPLSLLLFPGVLHIIKLRKDRGNCRQ